MNGLFERKDDRTGVVVRQYTKGAQRCAKAYFTTESFTSDDRFFFYYRDEPSARVLYRVEISDGHEERVFEDAPRGHSFGMDYLRDSAYVRGGDTVYRLDVYTGALTPVGELPRGVNTSHLTVSKSGFVWCSYQQANKIYALIRLDPAKGETRVMFQDDHNLGHCQACPGDDDTVMFVHETGGDALQRIWMYDVPTGAVRPYYVEKEGDWITHEVWGANGDYLYFISIPNQIIRGTRDGHRFDVLADNRRRYLHCAPDRSGRWLTADRINWQDSAGEFSEVVLINARTGMEIPLATTGKPATGDDHMHPAFNRRGDVVLFSCPDENGIAQVCSVDLSQVNWP